MAVIEAKFGLLQMQVKRVPGHPVELHKAALGIAPEAFNAVDMNAAPGKLVVAVVDPQVFIKPPHPPSRHSRASGPYE